jgi:hypothetical protein
MTDNGNANTIGDLIRSLFGFLNRGVYFLLGIMYQIFFNVASAQLFESETIKNFYGRIQLIIGVFMVFKLAVSILQGIMSPDQFSDPKSGFGNFITRVVVALALLTVLVPINVPDVENANSFEKYINNNGLLFGTLYSLQERILSNNTLGRLILGTTDEATSTSSADDSGMSEADRQTAMLERSSRIFASTILKGFLRINLLPTEIRESDSETDSQNWYCGANLSGTASEALQAYMQLDIDPSTLLSDEVLHADCEINDNILTSLANGASNIPIIGALFENFGGNSRYVFWFDGFFALIVGIVFLVILVGFTVDIAIRSIKLAILRLIAPIPVISYIEPKSSKDGGMFSSWVKALTSTYLDLFLRLAIVYFVIFLIQDMIVNGVVINEAGGMVGIISFIFIMLGLFFFAKMAPKFIKDALGLKGAGMSNIGLSGILGGAAMAVGGGGLAGFAMGAMQGSDAAVKGAAEGKPMPLGAAWSQNRDLMAKIRTGDKDAHGGLWGSALDRLNYATRERVAGAAGFGKRNKALADWNKDNAQAALNDAELETKLAQADLDRLKATNPGENLEWLKNNMYREEDSSILGADGKPIKKKVLDEDISRRYNAQKAWDEKFAAANDRYNKAIKDEASKKVAFAKASSGASKIEKYRADVYGVAPRAYDTTTSTYRSELETSDGVSFTSSAKPFDPMKGSSGVGRVDDDFPDGAGAGGGHSGPGGPPPH